MQSKKKKAIVISPHPDDDVIGMGGTIAKYCKEGWQILIIYVTDSRGLPGTFPELSDNQVFAMREKEAKKALSFLGSVSSQFLHIRSSDLGQKKVLDNLARELLRVFKNRHPDEIYVTSLVDKHPTHQCCTQATVKAVKKYGKKVNLYGYEVWSSLPQNPQIKAVDISDFADLKKKAILAHKSQVASKAYHESALGKNRYNAVSFDSYSSDEAKYLELFWEMNK